MTIAVRPITLGQRQYLPFLQRVQDGVKEQQPSNSAGPPLVSAPFADTAIPSASESPVIAATPRPPRPVLRDEQISPTSLEDMEPVLQ
jgi:hypothetical protein